MLVSVPKFEVKTISDSLHSTLASNTPRQIMVDI
jgi:hypothetical protein